MYGNPETTTGGRALKFYSSVRIDIRRIETIKNGDNAIGNHVRAKVVKNKVAPPFRIAEFDIIFGKGISRYGEILEIGLNFKLIQKSGSSFYINDERIAQGRENVRDYLEEHPEISLKIESEIRKANQPCRQKNA
jgi:recombination protein RecA